MKSPKPSTGLMLINLCFLFIAFQSTAQNKAIHHSPHLQWSFKTEGQVQSTPAIVGETIYFGSGDGNCYAANLKTGKEKWHFPTKGVVVSSPTFANNLVYFSSRDQYLYALDAASGKPAWSFSMGKERPYAWAFDNQTSSPVVVENSLYIGSGDGHVYALETKTGKEKWRFKTQGLVRATPAVANNVVYIGDTEGYFYALNANTGKQTWRFETEGVKFDPAQFGFDRKAIMFSAALTDELAIFGGRDGFLYAVERATGRERWRMDHKVSWIMSNPAIADGKVFTGTSDGRFVQAVDLQTGQEVWRFSIQNVCWSSPAVADGVVYIGSDEGRLYALDSQTGQKKWQFRVGGRVRSNPVAKDGMVYFGSHDGYLYALTGESTKNANYTPARKVVYWDKKEDAQSTFLDAALYVRDFLVQEGYEIQGDSTIAEFIQQRIQDRQPSVVVFPSQIFPASLLNDTTEAALLRQYLNAGGKVVYLNTPAPFAYARDPNTNQITGLQFSRMSKVLGIPYQGDNSFTFGGFYRASVTPEGVQMGLRGWWVNACAVDTNQVSTVLALDEQGKASAWIKNYGGRPGTGLVQLPPHSYFLANAAAVLRIIEYGL
jgi:outer membrane protein assembly factor BamB